MISLISSAYTIAQVQEPSALKKGACDCGSCSDCIGKNEDATLNDNAISVTISTEGRMAADQHFDKNKSDAKEKDNSEDHEYTEEELEQIKELKARDAEVRAHETAHLMAAGNLAMGGPSYEYQKGPDGKQYAVGGEVQIDSSPIKGDPEATIRKAARIQAAANAPADPSSQDRKVAAQAASMAMQARAELAEKKQEEKDEATEKAGNKKSDANSPYATSFDPGTILDLIA